MRKPNRLPSLLAVAVTSLLPACGFAAGAEGVTKEQDHATGLCEGWHGHAVLGRRGGLGWAMALQ